jgi:hypothetical protein
MTPVVVAALMTEDPLQDGGWSLPSMLIGYLLGALFAEFVGGHRDPRAARAPGSLHLGDYLPASVLAFQRGLGIVSGSLAIAYPFFDPHALTSLHLPGPAVVGAFGLTGVFTAALLELLERTIALRRRPLNGMEPAIEDALMSSSIHTVAGAGIALLLGNAGAMGAVSLLALTGSAAIAPAVGFVLAGVLIGSLVCWLRLASPHGFKVRRDGQQPVSR